MTEQMNLFDDLDTLTNKAKSDNSSSYIKNDTEDLQNIRGNVHSPPAPISLELETNIKNNDNETLIIHDKVRLQIIECNPDNEYYDDFIYLKYNYGKLEGKTGEIIGISVTKNGTTLYRVLFDDTEKKKYSIIELYRRELIWVG